jgi:phage FluMu protein Com
MGKVALSLIKYNLNIPSMAFIYCKKCGEYRYLTPHAFWNVNDLNVKCKDCGTINIITLEEALQYQKKGERQEDGK